jgi:hypothetical protein
VNFGFRFAFGFGIWFMLPTISSVVSLHYTTAMLYYTISHGICIHHTGIALIWANYYLPPFYLYFFGALFVLSVFRSDIIESTGYTFYSVSRIY